jgi:hypothetical protein
VPGLAHLAAPADVGEGDDQPAVEQAQARGREGHGHRKPVGAVAAQEHGGGAVPRRALLVDDRDRHRHAVGRGGEEALGDVLHAVVPAEHRLLLEQLGRLRVQVVVEDRARRHHRFVRVAQLARVELGVGGREHGIRGLREGHVLRHAGAEVDEAQPLAAPVPARAGRRTAGRNPRPSSITAGRWGMTSVQFSRPGRVHRRLHEAEVAAGVVHAEVEEAVVVVDVVLLVLDARGQQAPLAGGVVGGEHVRLRGGEAAHAQDQVGAAARAVPRRC